MQSLVPTFATWCSTDNNWGGGHHIESWGQSCWPIAQARGRLSIGVQERGGSVAVQNDDDNNDQDNCMVTQ